MERIMQDPEVMRTVLIGVAAFLVAVYSAVGEIKQHLLMTLSLVATLICILMTWFRVMGGL